MTDVVPKPMIEVHGKPVMQYVVEGLVAAKITDIAVALCYLPEAVEGYFGDGSALGARMRYFVESAPLGTAGAVPTVAITPLATVVSDENVKCGGRAYGISLATPLTIGVTYPA